MAGASSLSDVSNVIYSTYIHIWSPFIFYSHHYTDIVGRGRGDTKAGDRDLVPDLFITTKTVLTGVGVSIWWNVARKY